MPSSLKEGMTTIADFIQQVGGTTKVADDGGKPLSEPGSIGGDTKHPVGKVDDRLEKTPEGERFKENTEDVKKDQGKPSVENAPEAKTGQDAASIFNTAARFAKKAEGAVSTGGSASSDQLQIGTKVAPTGEDPKSETSSAKAGKKDPGSTHPARTDNDKIDGHKWAFDANTPLHQLANLMKEAGDNLCAKLAWHTQNSTGSQPPQQVQQKQAEVDPYLAQQAGWELAGLLNGTFDKQAADSMVQNTIYEIIKQAADDADNFIQWHEDLRKQAEGEMPPPPPGAGGPGGPPPGAGGGNEAAMMSALGGGGGAPPGGMGEGGGPPPGGGGPPPGAGGPPGAMGGGGEAGGGGHDQEVAQIAQMLEQLGITPEELQQAMGEQGGGDAGGAAPPPAAETGGTGDGPGGAGGGGGGGMETSASVGGGKRSQQKQAESTKMAEIRNYIQEVVSRSRRR